MNVERSGECVGMEVTIAVTERSDEPLRGAEVTAYFYSTGIWKTIPLDSTDKDGKTNFTPKDAGEYRITVTKSGYCTEGTDKFHVTSCSERAPATKSNESSGLEGTLTSTLTTLTETTTTSTPVSTTTTPALTTTTTSSIPPEKEESTSTTTASTQEKTQAKTKSTGFIGRFLDTVGKASIAAAILIIAFMVSRTIFKKEQPKDESFWQKEGSSRLENT